MYQLRVERQIEAAHHNGPEGDRCRNNHGHSWRVIVTYSYDDDALDEYGRGPDFGIIKATIDDFDHKDLNDMLEGPPSAERFAQRIFFDLGNSLGIDPRSVELFEGKGNSITFWGPDAS